MNNLVFLETIWQDVRYSLRAMRKNPAFTLTAVLTMALGIGANTAMFTVIRGVLLRPLIYPAPQQLMSISIDEMGRNERSGTLLPPRFEELQKDARSFSAIAAYLKSQEDMSLSGRGGPEAVKVARVSANFFTTLGVQPITGRGFLPEEDTPNGLAVMMISYRLWNRRFHADPRIAGKSEVLNSLPYAIVGVLPPGFSFPFANTDVWVAKPTEWSVLPARFWPYLTPLKAFARLKPGVGLEQAQAELDVLHRQYIRAHPENMDSRAGLAIHVTPLQTQLVANLRSTLWILFGAVGFVLLIACANVAGLLLARAASRSREFALRAAIGAARTRLIRQFLAESVVLAIGGGIFGSVLALWALTAVKHLAVLNTPGSAPLRVDGTVLAFTLGLSIATGIVFGLFPSLRASRRDLTNDLRESGVGAGRSLASPTLLGISTRGLLVIGQISLSMVLLIGAGLLMKSFLRLRAIDPGFESTNLLTMKVALPPAAYNTDQKRAAFFRELVQSVKAIPGVLDATVAMTMPTTTGWLGTNVLVEGQPVVDGSLQPTARLQSITPGYFRTMHIPLRRGREFTQRDNVSSAHAPVIINESFARRFWPNYPLGVSPVGQHLQEGVDHTGPMEIVGIVANIHEADLTTDMGPEFYVPNIVHPPQTAYLALRTARDPQLLTRAVRRAVLSIDEDQPLSDVRTMDDILESTMGERRLMTILLSSFAAIALLLSLVGIYGVIAYSVAQRTQEVGIRRALGAQRSDILRLVLNQGFVLAFAGVALGIGASFLLVRLMKGFLFEVSATDPMIFIVTAALFVLVALSASLVPARRATLIDPMSALRMG
jgi:putative ABC transport system permease protein